MHFYFHFDKLVLCFPNTPRNDGVQQLGEKKHEIWMNLKRNRIIKSAQFINRLVLNAENERAKKNTNFISKSTKQRENKNTFSTSNCWCWWWNFAKCIIIFINKKREVRTWRYASAQYSKAICVFLCLHSFKWTNRLMFDRNSLSLSLCVVVKLCNFKRNAHFFFDSVQKNYMHFSIRECLLLFYLLHKLARLFNQHKL